MAFDSFTIIYISECSPTQWRAFATNVAYIGNSVWFCLGAVVGLPQVLGSEQYWPYALALPALASLVYMGLGMGFLPDSPKHLYITLHDSVKTREAVKFYHGDQVDLERVEHQMLLEAALAHTQANAVTMRQVWETRHLRWPFLILLVVGLAFNAGAGASVIRPYSTEIMRLAFGMEESEAAMQTVLFVFVPTFVISVVAPLLVWLFPRRLHLFAGIVVAELGLFLIFFSQLLQLNPALAVLGMTLSMGSSCAAIGPVSEALPAELVPQKARAAAALFRLIPSGLYVIVQSQLFPVLSESIGPYALLVLSILDLPVLVILFAFLPETKGVEVDAVSARWRDREEEIELL